MFTLCVCVCLCHDLPLVTDRVVRNCNYLFCCKNNVLQPGKGCCRKQYANIYLYIYKSIEVILLMLLPFSTVVVHNANTHIVRD